MKIIQAIDTLIIKITKMLETNISDSNLKFFMIILDSLKEEISKPESSAEQLLGLSCAMTRYLQESNWDKTPLGEEIWELLGECRKYRKELNDRF